MTIKQDRVADRIRTILSELLLREIADPRLQGITVTDVKIDLELAYADIYVNALGDESRKPEVMEGLARAKSFLRREVGKLHAPIVARGRGNQHGSVDRHRQHRQTIVVGVLADQIHPPGRGRDDRGAAFIALHESADQSGHAITRRRHRCRPYPVRRPAFECAGRVLRLDKSRVPGP